MPERLSWYNNHMPYIPHPLTQERKRSAIVLIKSILKLENPEILCDHRKELLNILLWKLTEAECDDKHNTRYQTQGAIGCNDPRKLRHEHVFQRSKMIERLKKATPEQIDIILADAVGCTVTTEEHTRLSKYGNYYGWERYRKAGIAVIDTQTGERIVL
jgi:hypothetical protein